MSRALLTLLLALASAGLPAAHAAVAPESGLRPAPGSDESELWYAMDEAERHLRQSPLLVRDQQLNAYARSVLCKVTAELCPGIRLYIVDQPFFNASMAPNGMLVLWTGSLLRIRNEAQLALVLGHEFGHYRERHTLQQWRRMKKSSAWLSVVGVVTSGAGLGVAGMAANLAGAASMLKFGRDKEREADRIGFTTLASASYDPMAGVELWDAMLREEEARDYGKPLPVFSTHPQTRERRDDLRTAALAAGAAQQGLATKQLGTEEYRQATRAFLAHWLENELTRRMYSSSVEVIGELRIHAPPGDAGLYTFFLGEAYRRRNRADDAVRATSLYAEAITQPGAPPGAWREHGLALRKAGNRSAASSALHQYLALAPAAEDREFIDSYLAELENVQ